MKRNTEKSKKGGQLKPKGSQIVINKQKEQLAVRHKDK